MCGIIAYLGNQENGIEKLYEGLLILQNRGYDSAGISSIDTQNGRFLIHKYASRKDKNAFQLLEPHINEHRSFKNIIGHSRFRCSGIASDRNSHPHIDFTGSFSLVHNGIIENYKEIKTRLQELNIPFKSETDTEVIVNLIGYNYMVLQLSVEASIQQAISELEGTWGLVIQVLSEPNKLYCARHGSPLLIGFGEDYAIISSENPVFLKILRVISLWTILMSYI